MGRRMELQPSGGSTGLESPNGLTPWLVADAGSLAGAVDGNIYSWPLQVAWASHTMAAGLGEGIASEQVFQEGGSGSKN